jgi:hypothetical protein
MNTRQSIKCISLLGLLICLSGCGGGSSESADSVPTAIQSSDWDRLNWDNDNWG